MKHPAIINELVIDLSTGKFEINCPLDLSLMGPVAYGWDRFQKDAESITFGGGLLAGSVLPGTRRMIFCGHSPQWEGFYVSALGGAMYVFHRLGVNFAWLRGKCRQDSLLVIKRENDQWMVNIEPVDTQTIWQGYTDQTGRAWEGFYALQKYIFDKYHTQYGSIPFRILAVGPAAKNTRDGAIGSNQVKKGELSAIEDWAGRGGLGSQLYQQLHVAGIIFGGDCPDLDLKDSQELDGYFLDHFGEKAITADLALSQKYRYVPEFETGGTFGVNMYEAADRLFSFNYRSIHASDEKRLEQNENFIAGHYLKQFNEETIQPRNFDHCGEPCAVACKKFFGEFKKDYEPYEALGPNCGIFDQRAAEKINKYADTLGMDAIQAGGTVAWIMELIAEKLIAPANFGLDPQGLRFEFASDPAGFDVIRDSEYNAEYAVSILKMIVFGEQGGPFRRGMRAAAKYLDQQYNIRSIDRAVYTAHGSEGCMVPNQYWVPGMFAPMPLMGKYFSYYGVDFLPPGHLGHKNVERFTYELYSENSGACRFHRKWVEDIIDEIILSHYDLKIDYWAMNFNLARAISDFQSASSVFWESERVVEIIQGYLEKWQRDGFKNVDLDEWVARFQKDKWQAARDYWDAMYAGMQEAFAQGMSEPAHINHGMLIHPKT
jgi:glyceraldehyde-3-phosphate dehydrogenase (ferredoxin)